MDFIQQSLSLWDCTSWKLSGFPSSVIKIYSELEYLVDGQCSLVVCFNWGPPFGGGVYSSWSTPPVLLSFTFSLSPMVDSSISVPCYDSIIFISSVTPSNEVYPDVKFATPSYVNFAPPIFFSMSSMVTCSWNMMSLLLTILYFFGSHSL